MDLDKIQEIYKEAKADGNELLMATIRDVVEMRGFDAKKDLETSEE